jgi:hypothetical protein
VKKYLVVGLEASTTKNLSKIIASNLNIEKHQSYDGNGSIENSNFKVQHWSYPYGSRNNYPEVKSKDWDYIIICTRDFWCSKKSKIAYGHQRNEAKAHEEHLLGMEKLQKVITINDVKFFSYETWYLLKDLYMEKFLRDIDIDYKLKVEAKDINKKHITN